MVKLATPAMERSEPGVVVPMPTLPVLRMLKSVVVAEAVEVLNGNDLLKFGRLLDESWKLKRTLSDKISSAYIDDLYSTAIRAGAVGGKLLGAGGGGFVLFFAEPSRQGEIRQALKDLLEVPFKFEKLGSQIIFYQPNSGLIK